MRVSKHKSRSTRTHFLTQSGRLTCYIVVRLVETTKTKSFRPQGVGWLETLLGWRALVSGWRPLLLGWRPSLLGWRVQRTFDGRRLLSCQIALQGASVLRSPAFQLLLGALQPARPLRSEKLQKACTARTHLVALWCVKDRDLPILEGVHLETFWRCPDGPDVLSILKHSSSRQGPRRPGDFHRRTSQKEQVRPAKRTGHPAYPMESKVDPVDV